MPLISMRDMGVHNGGEVLCKGEVFSGCNPSFFGDLLTFCGRACFITRADLFYACGCFIKRGDTHMTYCDVESGY